MQNAKLKGASADYSAVKICSYAKLYLPFPREGDHAFGVVVGSYLTVILQFDRTTAVQKVHE